MAIETYDEPPLKAWSFSRLVEVFEKCAYRAELQFVKKIDQGHDETRDKALSRGKELHDKSDHFVRGELDELPKEFKKFEDAFREDRADYAEDSTRFVLEEQWAFTVEWQPTGWYDDDVWMRMIIDIGKWLDDDHTALYVRDYKSGKKEGNEVKHSQQGQLFTIGSFMKFPSLQAAKVRMTYLDHGKQSLPKTYSRDQAMGFLPSWERRAKAMTEARRFPPNPNRINCAYCPFGPNKGNGSCEYGVEL